MAARPILLFDGVCSLCDGAVQFVLRHDRRERFLFASLQSAQALPYLERAGLDAGYLASLVLVDEHGQIHTGAQAALGVARRLGAPWSILAAMARVVPRGAQEAAYAFVAQHRYRVFGTREACRIPTPAERARFLDAA